MDLVPNLTTNVLETFTETLGIRYHHMDVIVVVAAVNVPGTSGGLCVAKFWMTLVFSLSRALRHLHLSNAPK